MLMGRWLGPSNYGVYNSLLSILWVANLPLLSITSTSAKYFSYYGSLENTEIYSSLFRKIFQFVTILLFCEAALSPLLLILLKNFLKLGSYFPLLIVILTIWAQTYLFYFIGILQGLKLFEKYSIVSIINDTAKIAICLILFQYGLQVNAPLIAIFFSIIITSVLSLLIIKKSVGIEFKTTAVSSITFKELFMFYAPACGVVFLFSILTNSDTLILKHYFDSSEVGNVAVAGVLGKNLLLFSNAIVFVLFPEISRLDAQQKDTLSVLLRTIFYCLGMAFFFTVGFFLFGDDLIKLLFGTQYLTAYKYLKIYSFTLLPYVPLQILIYYFMAKRDFGISVPVLISFLFFLIILKTVPKTPVIILLVFGIAGIIALAGTSFLIIARKKYKPVLQQ